MNLNDLNDRQRDTLLAALEAYHDLLTGDLHPDDEDQCGQLERIASEHGAPLTTDEIEDLLEHVQASYAPRCSVADCGKPKIGRVNHQDYCHGHHPNTIHDPDCPVTGPCACGPNRPTPTEPVAREGTPGYDHAAGYHD